jgi:hypothetical protein
MKTVWRASLPQSDAERLHVQRASLKSRPLSRRYHLGQLALAELSLGDMLEAGPLKSHHAFPRVQPMSL